MSAEDLEKWREAAAAMPGGALALSLPLDVFLGEAIDVAKFHARYWKAQRDEDEAVVFPGLELAVGTGARKKPLSSKTGREIRSLQAAARHADTLYQFALAPAARAPTQEGREVLGKISAVLEWAFDDGVEDDNDQKLANLEARHGDPSNNDALASALEAYATLADEVRELIASFEIFDVAKIERARTLAEQLRDAPTSGTGGVNEESRAAIDLRNRVCQLLYQRMKLVRAAAAFVFQDYPEIRREATSSYLRRQRAARRRAAKEVEDKAGAEE
ncbi:MAG: hypothetical protein AAGF11_22440 [Myxococcota bacterium]